MATTKLAFTKNEQMEIVATVVLVGVKLLRPPCVEQARRLWVGVRRSLLLNQNATIGRRRVICITGIYVSILKIQTTPVAAVENVFAQRPVNRAPTKIKPGYHRVKFARPEHINQWQGKGSASPVLPARLGQQDRSAVVIVNVSPIITKVPTINVLPVLLV